ncbi:glycosyltransferase involved in cell wall biosynthesis [Aequitasia blattaphilus]|uniref:Glycosyltransferase n=1 Tax=Aequitasia blattaphilus TaxID=2949332 RepID=A0ABT1E6N7_9FIRM|nr:glycosyltransferase family 2 protein [Aequitasia blattaphilus]MCP1101259.1 glycosyltransferase [Aequitasia blattaphilus]MCR8613899.1 glycosyltransferase [Aequitasia blattaphilus]
MNKPFVSIILPTYGVEKYIEQSLQSLLKQSFRDFEIIVVDDASPDNSIEIAKRYRKIDERIKIICHEKNQGLSMARNTGIEVARGKYLWFMDPDDIVDKDLIERVYQSTLKNEADLIIFGLKEEYYEKDTYLYSNTRMPKEHCFRNKEELRRYIMELEQETLFGYAWNKFYKRDHLYKIDLKYEKVTLIEDIVFNIAFVKDIHSMNTLAFAPYHYGKRGTGSLTNKFVPDYYKLHERRIRDFYRLLRYWGEDTPKNKGILGSLYGRYVLSAIQRNFDPRSGLKRKDRKGFILDIFRNKLYIDLVPHAKAKESKALRIWLFIFKRKRAGLCLFMGRVVDIIRNRIPVFYNKTKSGR